MHNTRNQLISVLCVLLCFFMFFMHKNRTCKNYCLSQIQFMQFFFQNEQTNVFCTHKNMLLFVLFVSNKYVFRFVRKHLCLFNNSSCKTLVVSQLSQQQHYQFITISECYSQTQTVRICSICCVHCFPTILF